MGSLKSLALLALVFSLSLAVIADTSNDATHAKDEVKPSEATDVIEPQQGGRGGCRYGCCGWYRGRCRQCCRGPQAVESLEAEDVEANGVEPQQGGRGGCRYGCCGWYGRQCRYCCRGPQTVESLEVEAVEANAAEPQQAWGGGGGGGGCRYGCCGWSGGRCRYCCRGTQADVVEPQQRGCRHGCCGSYAYGQCSACCPAKQMTKEEDKKKEEAKP